MLRRHAAAQQQPPPAAACAARRAPTHAPLRCPSSHSPAPPPHSFPKQTVPAAVNELLSSLPARVDIQGLPFQAVFTYAVYTLNYVMVKVTKPGGRERGGTGGLGGETERACVCVCGGGGARGGEDCSHESCWGDAACGGR